MFTTGEEHLILAQSIGLTLIFLSEIVMGILPMYSPTFQSSKVAMGWANSFAAGMYYGVSRIIWGDFGSFFRGALIWVA